MSNRSFKRGFTFVELMLVTVMLTVVGMALYGVFFSGVSIWERVSRPAETEDVALFFRNISYDLRNSFELDNIRFRGERRQMSFPTRIKQHMKTGVEDSIGRVTYAYDRRKQCITKSQVNYSEVYRKKAGRERVVAEKVSSLDFEYFIYDEQDKKFSWVTHWQERDEPFGVEPDYRLPLIVRVAVGLPNEKSEKKFVKMIQIPTGCCWPLINEEER